MLLALLQLILVVTAYGFHNYVASEAFGERDEVVAPFLPVCLIRPLRDHICRESWDAFCVRSRAALDGGNAESRN